MSSSKRASALPPQPKPPTSLSSTVTISDAASLIGTNLIAISANTVIHPRARLNSTYAPIKVGQSCIFSERSSTGLQGPSSEQIEGCIIGRAVIIEVGATVEAREIGEGCLIEVNAVIGKGAVLGKHCKIGPFCKIAENEVVPDYTVVYGDGARREDRGEIDELKIRMVERQVDVLRKLIPSNLGKWS